MLRKLIKYDIKSNIKIVAGTYSFILLLAMLHLIMDKFTKIYPGAIQWMALEELTFVLHILRIAAGFGVTMVACVLHFRKNMFKDEGYLTHTLPVSEGEIFTGKFLSALILFLVNVAGTYITVAVSTGKLSWCFTILKKMTESMRESGFDTACMWLTAASLTVGMVYGISQIFGAITIGYSFGKKMNKDILSFIVYFAGYLIMQMISIVLLAVVSVSRGFVGADVTNVDNIGGYVKDVISGSLVIMIVMTVVYYAVSVFLLNRKLNLD